MTIQIKNNKILTAKKSIKIRANKQEYFNKVLASTSFENCQSGLEVCQRFWNAIFPSMETLALDNESLLEEQAIVLRKHADLDEAHKKLVVEHEELKEQFEETKIKLKNYQENYSNGR